LILDGALDNRTEADLAARVNVSARHLRRLFVEHLGVTPGALARSARTHFARRLLDDTDLSILEIAFATGFGSVRRLNRACRESSGWRRASCASVIAPAAVAQASSIDGPMCVRRR